MPLNTMPFSKMLSMMMFIALCLTGCDKEIPTEPRIELTSTKVPIPTTTQTIEPTFTPIHATSTTFSTATPTALPKFETKGLATPTQVNWIADLFIAYIKNSFDEAYRDNALYIIDSEGHKQVNVFDGLSGVRAGYFSWSPGGSWLLFSEYDQEVLKQLDKNIQRRPFYLWIVRPDGTERHRLISTDSETSINWSPDEKKFLVNCTVDQINLGICIVFPENGEVIKTGNVGKSPQFSPDGKRYAFIRDDKEIYIADEDGLVFDRVFSTETGHIPGYSWSLDQKSIITAVVNKTGCGNNLDGSTAFVKLNLKNQEIQVLRDVKWSINGWKLSPDQTFLLTHWFLCVGNAYDLYGIISLDSELVTWPLRNYANHEWTRDGKYIIETDWISGQQDFINPATGNYLGGFGPDFLDTLLDDSEKKNFTIQWQAQPILSTKTIK